MRWSEQPVALPLQPLSVLVARTPGLGERPPPADGLFVIVAGDVRAAVMQHLQGSHDEQGGLLLGEVFTDDGDRRGAASRAVILSQAIPAVEFESSGISLRMETGVWERARLALRPLEMIVGWYHSHPGLGAFFSATDVRTQAAFFPHPYSVGWVIDPLRGEEAFFVGQYSAPPGGLRTLTAGA